MDSKEVAAASSPVSGSSPNNNTGFEIDTDTAPKVGSNLNTGIHNSDSNGKVNFSIASDDEGFVSGEEDFDTASEKLTEAGPDEKEKSDGLAGENSGGPFAASSEVSAPIDENRAVSEVLVGDNVENVDKAGELEGGKDVEGGEGEPVKESRAVGVGDSVSDNLDETVVEGLEGKPEAPPVFAGDSVLNLDESGGESQGGTIESFGERSGTSAGEKEESKQLELLVNASESEEPEQASLVTNACEVANHDKSDSAAVDTSTVENDPQPMEEKNIEGISETGIEQLAVSETKENGTVSSSGDGGELLSGDQIQAGKSVNEGTYVSIQDDGMEKSESGISHWPEHAKPKSIHDAPEIVEAEDEAKIQMGEEAGLEGSISDGENDGMIFGSSEAAKQFIEELERGSGGNSFSGADSSLDQPQRIDGQIVTDSDDEVDTDEEGENKELFDSAALAALLKAATGADTDGGSITITSQDGSRLFSVERPAGLGSSLRSLRPTPRANRPNIFTPSTFSNSGDSESNLTDEEKKKLERLQHIQVKFFRLLHRLGLSTDESVAAQVTYRLTLAAGRQSGQLFSTEAAKAMALQLEAEEKDNLDFSLNILVLGKSGVGKSATLNSIFGEEKAQIDAFQPATTTVKEISGFVDGVKLRVFDTPGLKCSAMEQSFNRSILSSVKKFTKKNPPDVVLYVDRLDAQTRDLNDLPLLRTISGSLGSSIWRSAIVTLTHAASAPPDGPSGAPLSYEAFVTQRSHVVQHSIGQAVGDLRMMSPSLLNPVSLVENHPSCRRNREGQKVLPNGQTWRPQLLLLCYSMKILSEAGSLSKPQDPFDHRKLFGFRVRSPPLPYMLSSMLQSRAHPKLSTDQGGEIGDSDIDLDDLSDINNDDEDEYDQLPPFRPLRKAQIAKLSKEQRKAYFDEYDYRVKLLQNKQWKEELKRMKEMKTKGKDAEIVNGLTEEDADSAAAAPVAVPLPDMVLPPSFDGDNPAYRYRFLEPTSQFLARPVLDTHSWDHDCGYDGVNVEHSLAILNSFPAAVTVQVTKDKKDFSISLDSSIAAKHGENVSSMAGFDIQSIGKQLAYVVRGETKFKNLKKNRTAGGVSITFLGENVVPGIKIEDQITLGKQYALVGSAGVVRSQQDTAYGANFELQRREQDFPIGQVQSTFSMSVIKWRGDLALGFNSLAQFSVGRGSKVAVRAGINNKLSGQVTVRASSSEHLSLALAAIVPTVISIYKKLCPGVGDKHLMY